MFGIKSFDDLKAKATAAAATVRTKVSEAATSATAEASDLFTGVGLGGGLDKGATPGSASKDGAGGAGGGGGGSSALEEAQANVLKYKRILKKELGMKKALEADRAEALRFIVSTGILPSPGEDGSSDPSAAFPAGSLSRRMLLEGWSRALACAGLGDGAAAALQGLPPAEEGGEQQEEQPTPQAYTLPTSAQVVAFENRAMMVKEKMTGALGKLKEVADERNSLRIQLAEALVKVTGGGGGSGEVAAASATPTADPALAKALEEQRQRVATLEASLSQAKAALKAATESGGGAAAAASAAAAKAGKAAEATLAACRKELAEARTELTAERHKLKGVMGGLEGALGGVVTLLLAAATTAAAAGSGGSGASTSSSSSSAAAAAAVLGAAEEVGSLGPLMPTLRSLVGAASGAGKALGGVRQEVESLQAQVSSLKAAAAAAAAEATASATAAAAAAAAAGSGNSSTAATAAAEQAAAAATAAAATATATAAAAEAALQQALAGRRVAEEEVSELSARLQHLDATHATLVQRMADLGREHGAAMEALRLTNARELEGVGEAAREKSAAAGVEVEGLRREVERLKGALVGKEGEVGEALRRAGAAAAALGKAREEARVKAEEGARGELEGVVGELTTLRGKWEGAVGEARAAQATIASLQSALASALAAGEAAKGASGEAQSLASALERSGAALKERTLECTALQGTVADLTQRLGVAEEAVRSVVSSSASADQSSQRLSEEVGALRVAGEKMAVQLASALEQLEGVKAERDALEVSKAELKKRATARLKEQKETLQATLANSVEDFDAQVKAAEASRDAAFLEVADVKRGMEKLEAQLAEALAQCAASSSDAATEMLALQEESERIRAEAEDREKVSGNQVKGLRREADEALRALGEREGEIRAIRANANATQAALVSERDGLARRLRTLQQALEEERARSVSLEAAASAAAEARMAAKLQSLEEQRSTDRSIVAEVRRDAAGVIDKVRTQLREQEMQALDAMAAAQNASASRSSLQQQIRQLQSQLRDAHSQVEAGKVQLQQMMAQIHRASAANANSSAQAFFSPTRNMQPPSPRG